MLQGGIEHAQLVLAAHEPREAASPGDIEATAGRANADKLVDADGPARALHLELPQIAELR